MIPRAQLIAERRMFEAFLAMPTLPARIWRAPRVEQIWRRPISHKLVLQRVREGVLYKVIAHEAGCSPKYVCELAVRAGLRRRPVPLSAGCRRPTEASREAAHLGVPSLNSGRANAALSLSSTAEASQP